MKKIIALLTLTLSLSAFADRRCVQYKVYDKEQLVGLVSEGGLAITNNGDEDNVLKRCFISPEGFKFSRSRQVSNPFGPPRNRTFYYNYTCKCSGYDGLDNNVLAEVIATEVAEKISVKMNEENSKNIEKTVNATFEMHGDLVKSLQTFVNDLMELKESK